MNWPQWTILVASLIVLLGHCVGAVRNRDLTSGGATATILLTVALTVGYWMVIRAGGFW